MENNAPVSRVGLRSLPQRQVTITMIGVMLAMFLAALDQTIVGTAMPKIVGDLGGFAHYTWLTTAYLLTSTVVMPITGKLTDMYGRKPFFLAGIIIFVSGSVLCGLSQTMLQIIIARGFQGIGAGVIMSNAFSVIGDLFPPAQRGKVQGMMAVVFGLSSIVGPTLGGFITDNLSWHWIFYINVPMGVATIVLFIFFYPHMQPDTKKHAIDWAGMTALILAVVPLLLALSLGGSEWAWRSVEIIGMFAVSALALVAFPFIENRAAEPIFPMSLFKNRIISISLIATFLSAFGMFGGIVFVPLFFQGVLGASATSSGSFLTPMMLGLILGSFLSGMALTKAGGHYKIQGAIGLALIFVGMILLSRMNLDTSYAQAIFNIVWLGIGLGITMPIYMIAVQNSVPYEQLGSASSTVPFVRSIGSTVGLAIFGGVLTNKFASEFAANVPAAVKAAVPPETLSSLTSSAQTLLNPDAQSGIKMMFDKMGPQGATLYQQTVKALQQALTSALSEVFLICAGVIVIAFIANWFIKEIPLRKHHDMGNGEGPTPRE